MMTDEHNHPVLVVGAGIAGMAAGMLLAERGQAVVLLDTAPAIGGSMHLLDHTFPTNSCGLCLMLPHQPALCPSFECDRHPAVRLMPATELLALEGEPGAFVARVRHRPRYVDPARCTGCGACAAVCPVVRPHEHEGRLAPGKAIYRPPGLRVVPDAWTIDMGYCTRCGACVDACPAGAIDLDAPAQDEALPVAAVLLAPGFAPFAARLKGEYGYGVYDNVLTSFEFERMVSLAGSSAGRLRRPSDGRLPQRIAFLSCVGSRDPVSGAGHCSSACCMYTAKQVALAKQAAPDVEATVYYMDLRAVGKGFEAYLAGVQALAGVTYRRAMPSVVHQVAGSRALRLSYAGEDGRVHEAEHDLVVLALGFAPPVGMAAVAAAVGVGLNSYGFARTDPAHPVRTERPGVFVCGAFREPKDIPETVVEAAAAAAEVAAWVGARSTPERAGRPKPVERAVAEEAPRVGVFVCACDGELASLDVAALAAWAGGEPDVAVAQVVERACRPEGQAAIAAAVQAGGLNRVVVAGCTPRLHGEAFAALMGAAGLDERLLARVALREQVVYPHRAAPATEVAAKAQNLVGMAVASLRAMHGVEKLRPGTRRALTARAVVVGGGAAGMSAALVLADQGIEVVLVERAEVLGGQWRHLRYQADGSDVQGALAARVGQVMAHPGIRVHLGSEVQAFEGRPGAYRTVIGGAGPGPGETETVEHGVLVVATGGRPVETREYLYGQHPGVMTQRELETQLAAGTLGTDVGRVVMIQCVGSREPGRAYCSRVCCTQAVKNALALKRQQPEREVYVLYRELRTYGFREAVYQAAREAGVVFVRYDLADPVGVSGTGKPVVQAVGEQLEVGVREPVTGRWLALKADRVVLSVGLEPEDAGALATILGVARDGDGFFREEQAKMKPLDLGRGLYVAGLAHSPRFLDEAVVAGQGAGMRAAAYLAPGEVEDRATAVWVNERLCSYCGLCVAACPYGARVLNEDERVAEVDEGLCLGCGVCAVVCPNKATLQKAFEHPQLLATIDAALS